MTLIAVRVTDCGRVLLELNVTYHSLSEKGPADCGRVAIEALNEVEGRVIKRRYQGFIQ